jgi:hypothetical protein
MKLRIKIESGGLFGQLVGFLIGYWIIGPIIGGLLMLAFWLWLLW